MPENVHSRALRGRHVILTNVTFIVIIPPSRRRLSSPQNGRNVSLIAKLLLRHQTRLTFCWLYSSNSEFGYCYYNVDNFVNRSATALSICQPLRFDMPYPSLEVVWDVEKDMC